jgi:MATE family multidrug resistance protein
LFHTNTTTMASTAERADEEACRVALLDAGVKEEWQVAEGHHHGQRGGESEGGNKQQLGARVWEESRKLWDIVAPAIFSRVVTYSMNVITQAFAGHLGDLELAAISIANTVVVGFNFGLMVRTLPRSDPSLHPSKLSLRPTARPIEKLRTCNLARES